MSWFRVQTEQTEHTVHPWAVNSLLLLSYSLRDVPLLLTVPSSFFVPKHSGTSRVLLSPNFLALGLKVGATLPDFLSGFWVWNLSLQGFAGHALWTEPPPRLLAATPLSLLCLPVEMTTFLTKPASIFPSHTSLSSQSLDDPSGQH